MQLVKFKLFDGDQLIREIPFKEGMNIITSKDEVGNSIGKSTALRAIDFCLGGELKKLWTDPETKAVNEKVKQFLTSGNVVFHLEVFLDGYLCTINRCATFTNSRIKCLSSIDGTEYKSDTAFRQFLPATLGHQVARPTFKQIKRRFLRISKKSSNQTLRYLNAFTTDDDYRFVNLYLFGFDGEDKLQEEFKLKQQLTDLDNRQKVLLNGLNLENYKNQLHRIDADINDLLAKEETIDITGVQESVLESLRKTREHIADLSANISHLEIRLRYYRKTVGEYENKIQKVEVETIRKIYEEAKIIIPDLSKTFEETVTFHNSMHESKANYVKQQIDIIENQLFDQKLALRVALGNEENLVKEVAAVGQLDGFILIEKAIQEQREKRGRINFVFSEVTRILLRIEHVGKKLRQIRTINKELEDEFNKKLGVFNSSYSPLAKKVLGVSLKLQKESNDDGIITFQIDKENEIAGDGAPRAAAMAFELALVKYSKEIGSKLPKFTMQDYLEAVDDDKLEKLFGFANKHKVQTVIAILNDKISFLDPKFCKENTILQLSQEDKFFKV